MSLTRDDFKQLQAMMTNTVSDALNAVVLPRFDAQDVIIDQHTEILKHHSALLEEHSATLEEHGVLLQEHRLLLQEHSQAIIHLGDDVRGCRQDIAAMRQDLNMVQRMVLDHDSDIKELYGLLPKPAHKANACG